MDINEIDDLEDYMDETPQDSPEIPSIDQIDELEEGNQQDQDNDYSVIERFLQERGVDPRSVKFEKKLQILMIYQTMTSTTF